MTTAELAYRLLRHASVSDLAALTFSQATELAGAISYAVGEYFRMGPDMLRRTSAAAILPAPVELTDLLIAQGAVDVTTGTPFTVAQRGASLDIEGDPVRNTVVSPTGWLHPYQGESGNKRAVVHGDCVPISFRVLERLVSDPWIMDNQQERRRPLKRAAVEHDMARNLSDGASEPEYYAIQTTGTSRASEAQYLIRVWPAPKKQMVLRFEVDAAPDAYDQSAFTDLVLDLPFSDSQVETIVFPIAEERLLASSLLTEVPDRVVSAIARDAERGRHFLSRLPRDHGRSQGRVFTRPGF